MSFFLVSKTFHLSCIIWCFFFFSFFENLLARRFSSSPRSFEELVKSIGEINLSKFARPQILSYNIVLIVCAPAGLSPALPPPHGHDSGVVLLNY
jgi:hypothetical protein